MGFPDLMQMLDIQNFGLSGPCELEFLQVRISFVMPEQQSDKRVHTR